MSNSSNIKVAVITGGGELSALREVPASDLEAPYSFE